jgi:alkaline phosphatase
VTVLAVWALAVAAGCGPLRPPATDATAAKRNVILLVGDGLGATALTMARNYHLGAAGRLEIDRLPVTGSCTTWAVEEDDPTRPDYVTDSSSSATAMATGRKTSNRRVSTEPGTDAPLATILEQARRAGYRTGLVSTAHLADATPAAFAAHVNYRWCFDPAMMAACPTFAKMSGGPGSIVEQMIDVRPDVLLGGGAASFAQRIPAGTHAGHTVLDAAAEAGYRVVTTAAELAVVEAGSPVLGLFAADNFTPAWEGEAASFPPGRPQRCRAAQIPEAQPGLVPMLEAALRLLDAEAGPGFFLMAEAAMIDKQAHAADACGQIGETIELDRAVAVARRFAELHPGTLLIVVGDHDHAPVIVDTRYAVVAPGVTTTLETVEGASMTIGYATSTFTYKQQHSGAPVPVFSLGPDAEALDGLVDHTDIYRVMARRLGVGPAGRAAGDGPP